MEVKILLTAFETFDSEMINPALEAVKLVADKIRDCDQSDGLSY